MQIAPRLSSRNWREAASFCTIRGRCSKKRMRPMVSNQTFYCKIQFIRWDMEYLIIERKI